MIQDAHTQYTVFDGMTNGPQAHLVNGGVEMDEKP
jgi:hypothetical protein